MDTSVTPNEAVVRALRAALAERGMGQVDLAKRCEVSRSFVVKRLTGHVRLQVADVFAFAYAIGVTPSSVVEHAQRILDAEEATA